MWIGTGWLGDEMEFTTENTEKSGEKQRGFDVIFCGKKIAHVEGVESKEATVDSCLRRNDGCVETGYLSYPDCPPDQQQGLCFKVSCTHCWAEYRERMRDNEEVSAGQ